MRRLRMLLVIAGGFALATVAIGQTDKVRIARMETWGAIVPGEIVEMTVEGLPTKSNVDSAEDQPDVLVIQQGIAHKARVRMSFTMLMPASLTDPNFSDLKAYKHILFKVPEGLVEGEAKISVSYKGDGMDEADVKIGTRPPRPLFGFRTVSVSRDGVPPSRVGKGPLPLLKLQRGKESEVYIRPLIDPDQADSAIIVTFRQGPTNMQAPVRILERKSKMYSEGDIRTFSQPGFEIRVGVPSGLATGKATMEVQIRAGGQMSDSASSEVEIVDPAAALENPGSMSPHIISLTPAKVGIGQAITLVVERQTLEPDPARVLIAVEQGTKAVTLKPEKNLALYRPFKSGNLPAVITVRLNEEITGLAEVRIVNPALPEQASKSNPIALEISDHVLPPKITGITDATPEELTPLRGMREASLKAGRDFPEYNPSNRYITIHGTGMDQNPAFIIVKFEQDGKSFILSYDDFSVSMSDRHIVRLPAKVKAGPVQVTITNLGAGRFSEPVTITAEITPAKSEK